MSHKLLELETINVSSDGGRGVGGIVEGCG